MSNVKTITSFQLTEINISTAVELLYLSRVECLQFFSLIIHDALNFESTPYLHAQFFSPIYRHLIYNLISKSGYIKIYD